MCFVYGEYWKHPWRDLAEFTLNQLGQALTQEVGDGAYLSLRVTSFGNVQAEIEVRPEALIKSIKAIRKLAKSKTI